MADEPKDSSSGTAVAEPSYQPPPEPAAPEPPAEPAAPAVPVETAPAAKVTLPKSITPPTKTGRFQERISDLVNQRNAANREAEQLREEVSRLKAMPKAEQKASIKSMELAQTGPVLNPEDFETYGAYVQALVAQTVEQREAQTKSQRAADAYETHKQQRLETFNTQAAPLAEQYGEGFWDAITDTTLPISEAMADAVLELDDLGPYTMLYLAAHRDEAMKIARMNPRAATIAIGRLATQLDFEIKHGDNAGGAQSGAPLSEPTGGSTAMGGAPLPRPTPVQIPRGSAPALNTSPSDKDSVDDWLKKETDRLRRINPNMRFYGARIIPYIALLFLVAS